MLEVGHQMSGDGPLCLGSEMVPEDGVLEDDAVQIHAPGAGVGVEDGDADAVGRSVGTWCRRVVRRRELQVHRQKPPEMGAPLREDSVPGVDGDEILAQCRVHLDEYGHEFLLLLASCHAAKVMRNLF